jgi:tetratricopeptide (TPR) repeat protein
LAAVLQEQGRHAEAEREHRTVLELRQKVLGARHPDVFLSCFNLGLCLEAQSRLDEALPCMRRAQTGFQKLLGANHPHAQFAAESVQRIEAEMKP